jgi:hypothetical protein
MAEDQSYDFEKEKKQTYLYENIVEAGYDAELFAEYMQEVMGISLLLSKPCL